MREISELVGAELPLLVFYHNTDYLAVRKGVKALDDVQGGQKADRGSAPTRATPDFGTFSDREVKQPEARRKVSPGPLILSLSKDAWFDKLTMSGFRPPDQILASPLTQILFALRWWRRWRKSFQVYLARTW